MAAAQRIPARPRPSRQEWPPILSQEIADAIAEREGRTTPPQVRAMHTTVWRELAPLREAMRRVGRQRQGAIREPSPARPLTTEQQED